MMIIRTETTIPRTFILMTIDQLTIIVSHGKRNPFQMLNKFGIT